MALRDTKGDPELQDVEESGKRGKGKGGKGKGRYVEAKKKRGVKGRKDAEKQPAVTRPQVVIEKLDWLVSGYRQAKEMAETNSDDIRAVAKESGYNASEVRALVVAKAGENFEEKHRKVEQQHELFEEAAK